MTDSHPEAVVNWTVVPIAEEHIVGFHAVLDEVARERRWLSFLDAGLLEDTRQFVRNNIARHHPQFVAVRDGAVIGWADVVPASRPLYAHVGTLGMGIREAYRGQGLGKLLVLAALAGAKARGMTRIELTVREANLRAIGLYRSVGFVTEGIKRDAIFLDGQYENVLFMAVLLEDDRRGAKRPVAAAFAPPLNALDDLAVPVRGVLIDLDGTLVDTLGDFRAALDAMRVELSLGPLREHDVRQWVGRGSEYLVKQALAGDWSPDQMHADFDHALELYYQHYALANGRYSSLYPGVEEGLAALKDMGMVLACVTNKPRHFAVPLLQRFGILDGFALVLGGDAGGPKKPDPAPFMAAAAQLQLPCRELIAIGDSVNDVGAARGAQMRVLLVPYGYNHGQPVQQAGADGIVLSLLEGARWILSNNRAPENRSIS